MPNHCVFILSLYLCIDVLCSDLFSFTAARVSNKLTCLPIYLKLTIHYIQCRPLHITQH